jgi:hypothetical protein
LVEILEKVFDTDFLPKYFYGVFELPLPRNAQKLTKKKAKKKKSDGGWVGLRFSKCTGGPVDFFGGPSPCGVWQPEPDGRRRAAQNKSNVNPPPLFFV